MTNTFKNIVVKETDETLVELALKGNKSALENLIKKHQNWIYNVALSMVSDSNDAADITQEVLIKVITKLGNFKGKSSFRTWMYRIVRNHFLNMRRGKFEKQPMSFADFADGLNEIPDEILSNHSYEVEEKIIVEEAKLSCMKGMLLCLDREQRFIFIIGELFGFSDTIGSEVMEITKASFRVKLHRAKHQLYNFMDNKCGLINKKNPCRCARKTSGFIKRGFVDPVNLHFQKGRLTAIEKVAEKKVFEYDNEVSDKYTQLFQQHPFVQSPDSLKSVKKLLSSKSIRDTFNLD